MGGSGGQFIAKPKPEREARIRKQRERAQQQKLDGDVNKLLRSVLTTYERDPETTNEHLEQLRDCLSEVANIESFLFGGSVAKHTFVDGLSDIDALAVLDPACCEGKTPKEIIEGFHQELVEKLPSSSIEAVRKGELAVTIKFKGGYEVQILPALKVRDKIAIRNSEGRGWLAIQPGKFQKELSSQNKKLGGVLVPTIKLVKSIVSSLPEECRPSGYHVESMCVKAAETYDGPSTPKSVLPHMLRAASELVLSPIRDITGQSRSVDARLGNPNSKQRKEASKGLRKLACRLESANSIDGWIDVVVG